MDAGERGRDWQPVAPGERHIALDALRGLALFGVLLVNLQSDFRVPLAEEILNPHPGDTAADRAVGLLIKHLLEFKAFAVFSLLFGVGLAIFYERAGARSDNASGFLARRLLVLLALGLVHLLLIWNGDILTLYAVSGLLLLPFVRLPVLALTALGVAAILCQFFGLMNAVFPSAGTLKALAAEAATVYRTGGFAETLSFHLRESRLMIVPLLVGSMPKTWGLMALGVAAWRAGLVSDPTRHRGHLVRVLLVAGALGGTATALSAYAATTGSALAIPPKLAEFAYLPLAFAYAAGGMLLLSNARLPVGAFAAAGQTALSNYLAASVAFSLIFYGYGLALCGRLGSAPAAAIGTAVYAALVAVSRWWLRRYRFGPVEWLWRSLTYGRLQPMRLAQPGAQRAARPAPR